MKVMTNTHFLPPISIAEYVNFLSNELLYMITGHSMLFLESPLCLS